MRKRFITRGLALFAVLVLSFGLVACGGNAPARDEPESGQASVSEPITRAEPGSDPAPGSDPSSGSQTEATGFIGTYNLSSMTMGGITVEGSELNAALEAMGGAEGNKLEVLDGQNLCMTFAGQAIELPYTAYGNVLTCSDYSGSFDLVFEGNRVTWDVPESLAGEGNAFVMIFTRS